MKRILTSASVAALCTAPGLASAQDFFDLGTFVLTANQTPSETDRTGAAVEIIEEADVQKNGTTRVIDRLDTLPGVTFSGNGPVGTTQTLSIRGLPARYAPVYIYGIDFNNPTAPQSQFDFGTLLTPGLGRIEVLKGSQSALYGSEAIGGVVNITPPVLDEPGQRLDFSAEFGSYDTFATSVGYTQRTDRGQLSFNIAHAQSDGFSAAEEDNGNTEEDGYETTRLLFSGELQATDSLTIGGALILEDSKVEIDGFVGFSIGDTASVNYVDRTGARVFATLDGGAIEHTFALAYTLTERLDPTGFTRLSEGERVEFDYQGVTELDAATLSFGLQHSKEESRRFAATNSADKYETTSAWIEGQFALSSDVDVSLSARADDHSQFGSATTGRAALAWRLSDATTLRTSLATGFRAPSLFELFNPSFGNANLQPEESRSFDISLEHSYATGANVKAGLFYTEIDDLIGFAGGGYNQVAGTSVSKGVELSAVFPVGEAVDLFGSYTYTDAKDQNGNQILRVPRHELVLGVDADITDRLSAALTVSHYADRANDGGQVMDDYTRVDASFSYDITDTSQAYLRIENLMDEDYQTAAGYGTSDRAAFFGIRASF